MPHLSSKNKLYVEVYVGWYGTNSFLLLELTVCHDYLGKHYGYVVQYRSPALPCSTVHTSYATDLKHRNPFKFGSQAFSSLAQLCP